MRCHAVHSLCKALVCCCQVDAAGYTEHVRWGRGVRMITRQA